MTPLAEREHLLSLFNEAIEQGAGKAKAADVMDLELRTLQRWQRPETARADGRARRLYRLGIQFLPHSPPSEAIEPPPWLSIAGGAEQTKGLGRDQLILHLDNGSPMKGATLRKLGITPSRSRPAASNDNPYSESLFKTLKYDARYPSQPFATDTVTAAFSS